MYKTRVFLNDLVQQSHFLSRKGKNIYEAYNTLNQLLLFSFCSLVPLLVKWWTGPVLNRHKKHALPLENFQRVPKISKTGAPKSLIYSVSTLMPILCQIISVHFLQYLIILRLAICKYFWAVHLCLHDQEVVLFCSYKTFFRINDCLVVYA